MNLLVRTNRDQAISAPIDAREAARRIVCNCRSETIQSVRSSPPIHLPLLAYQLMFPRFDHDHYWGRFERLLADQLEHATIRHVELTRVWDDRLMQAVALPKPMERP